MSPSGAFSLKVFLLVKLPGGSSERRDYGVSPFYFKNVVLLLIRRDGVP